MSTDATGEKQRPAHLFQPGRSGNPSGRPRGARGKLSENFLRDLAECWERLGVDALEKCAKERPEVLIKVIASLLPRDVRIDVTLDAGDFAAKFRSACALLGNAEPPQRSAQPRRPLRNQPLVIEHEP